MKAKELVERLNCMKIQQEYDWEEHIPEEIYNKYFKDKIVKKELNVYKNDAYETAIDVVEIDDNEYIGVMYIVDTYDENIEIKHCLYTLIFYEMQQIKEITYKKKEN